MTPTLIATADPDFVGLAREELQTAVPQAKTAAELAPGVWSAHLPQGFFPLAQQWRRSPPIFVRHVCPVQVMMSLHGRSADVQAIRRRMESELLPFFEPDLPFSVQTRIFGPAPYRPFAVNDALAAAVQQGVPAPLDVRRPAQILSVVIAGHNAYLGLSAARHNLSDWAGGARRFARDAGQISRAEFKLLEAIEVFGVALPPRGVALDLGAAPGGWTRVLRGHEQYVTAVDPAALHPALQGDKNVRHLPITAEAYLAHPPDTFDLIVNDMRQDARDSARLMVAYAPYLYTHGHGLITLKLPGERRRPPLDRALSILQQAYTIAGARQLFHNRSEITVFLRKKA